ncbi:MAG: prolipoprotein diacylglyceryl transferase [Deltaproteobacteria bacterium]|nr:prolipoprotein diacylglyceryl transferase [Deltaproteobacteria bacterium]
MHPILFTFPDWLPLVGGRSLHFYGFFIATGVLLGILWVRREAKRLDIDVQKIMDLYLNVFIAGLVGSRILYIIHSVPNFWDDPLVLFRVWEGGLVFQGGVIGAVLVMIWLVRRYQLKFFQIADVFVPALSLGHAFGRLGCFMAGCCHGKQCDPDFLFAVRFPALPESIAPPHIPLYPTQLFEAGGEFLIFAFLIYFRKHKKFDGAVFLLYLILYSILRSILEVYRGDMIRGFVIEPYVSNAQFLSILSIILAIGFWISLKRRSDKSGE